MSENRSRIFDRGADIKIAAVRVVGRDEVEAAVVFVVEARRIHEAARTGRIECVGKLLDEKWAEVVGKCDEILVAEKFDHLLFARLIRGEERLMIGGGAGGAFRIGISERWIGQQRFER